MFRSVVTIDFDSRDERGCRLPPVGSLRIACDEPGCRNATAPRVCIGEPSDWDYGMVRAGAPHEGFTRRYEGAIGRDYCAEHSEVGGR